jgi:uncharacterized cupin superfamily protein
MSMYHWEADQEDFLVLAGEALLIVGVRSARSRSGTSSTARRTEAHHRRAGGGPAVVLAVGARDRTQGRDWGGYTVDATALRHGRGWRRRRRRRRRLVY